MLKKLSTVLAAVIALGIPLTSVVTNAPPAGAAYPVTIESNLCYQSVKGACTDGVSHEFDAYLPSGATQKTPGVIVIHGGGFIGGDKAGFATIATQLAADGMAAFSINYRLDSATTVGFPMESQDVMAAISYIRAHAHRFNVDGTRLASFGSSAGATLAVYSAMQAQRSDPSAQVVADVGWSGGYDFTVGPSGTIDPTQLRNAEYYLGCSDPTVPACQATATAASAVSLVQPGDPATLLASSTDYKLGCEIVNPAQAKEMAGDLQHAGDTVQLDLNSECAHASGYANIELTPTVTFLEAHLFVAPTIISRSATNFRVGSDKTFTVKTRANPTATVTESGSLPAGVSFTTSGTGDATIAGTPGPGTSGSYPLVLTAVNGAAAAGVQGFTLTVK
ncbi:MAG TPA: alpha/beta hydrolase [Acidimicrobiales bacterium]|nr:alpha/beta hydrolase [Acidimicrobiales bacterium]